ncbi:MAG TPA: hypothetical protein VHR47_07145 [Bacillota bacterium]|jgi:hypothetical protein|nr:hypothetical protein [Bacillota bacterium]
MIAVIIADLGAWIKRGSRPSLAIILGMLAIIAGVTYFRPEAIGEFFTLAVIWAGLFAGEERWGNPEVWRWVSRGEFLPLRVMTAKSVAIILLYLLLMAAILPILVLARMVWGVPIDRLWLLFWAWLMTMETSFALGITAHYFRDQNPYFGSILTIVGLVTTALVPWLQPVNPFIRVWKIIGSVNPGDQGVFIIANLVAMIGMLTLVGWRLRREVIWRLGQQLHR